MPPHLHTSGVNYDTNAGYSKRGFSNVRREYDFPRSLKALLGEAASLAPQALFRKLDADEPPTWRNTVQRDAKDLPID